MELIEYFKLGRMSAQSFKGEWSRDSASRTLANSDGTKYEYLKSGSGLLVYYVFRVHVDEFMQSDLAGGS